jgi:hypothetical protein
MTSYYTGGRANVVCLIADAGLPHRLKLPEMVQISARRFSQLWYAMRAHSGHDETRKN